MAHSGINLPVAELTDLELGYIGGLLKLDLWVDEQAQFEAFQELKNRRPPSPERKG